MKTIGLFFKSEIKSLFIYQSIILEENNEDMYLKFALTYIMENYDKVFFQMHKGTSFVEAFLKELDFLNFSKLRDARTV